MKGKFVVGAEMRCLSYLLANHRNDLPRDLQAEAEALEEETKA